jgi:ABC-type lipoprotein release transport system permease subunit
MAKLRAITRLIVRLRAQNRAQSRTREVLLAIALTVAAVIFIVAAMGGIDQRAQSKHVHSEEPHADTDK